MQPEFLVFSIIILLFSVIVHEVMHGYVALRFGDHTAQRQGRLTLNPLPHIDPIGTILLPALILLPAMITGTPPGPFLAWAKPVPVNPLNFTNLRKGELLVSGAGILANFGLSIVAAVLFHALGTLPGMPFAVLDVLRFAVLINLYLAIFNLMPIPPLDGSKVLMSQLPLKLAIEYQKLERYGFLILIFLIFIFPEPIFFILGTLVRFLSSLLGF